MSHDLETRMRYRTRPASMEIVATTKRGKEFLCNWVPEEDPPMREKDGSMWIILAEPDVKKCLADAVVLGLKLAA